MHTYIGSDPGFKPEASCTAVAYDTPNPTRYDCIIVILYINEYKNSLVGSCAGSIGVKPQPHRKPL